jgi:NADH-quinone oxidoreductase subunit L
MTIPLMFLAIASIVVGFIPFSEFVTSDGIPFETEMHWNIAIPSVLIGLAGIFIAWIMYKKETAIPAKIASGLGTFYKATYNKFYIDEIYMFITKKIIFNKISMPVAWFDRHVVDGTMNAISNVVNIASEKIKGFQSGQLQKYAYIFVSGAIILIIVFVYLMP